MKTKMKTILAMLLTAGIFLNLLGCNSSTDGGSSLNEASSETASDSTASNQASNESTAQSGTNRPTSSTGTQQNASTGTNRPTSSTGTQQETPVNPTGSTGEIGEFEMKSPYINEIVATLKPTFAWTAAKNADSYTLVVEELNAKGKFQKKIEQKGITKTRYTLPTNLDANKLYRWSITAVNKTHTFTSDTGFADYGKNIPFMAVSYKEHEANKGLNFTFKNKVSEEVLRNYLSRSMIADVQSESLGTFFENLRMILHTGAKYIGRAEISWTPDLKEYSYYNDIKENLAYAHSLDPEIVFEACVFETTSKKVNDIPIPDWVFQAFDQPVEKRNFSYDKMIYTNGKWLNQWGTDCSVPDMTRIETQMFFYYRACTYIDLGFEGLHMGQVHLIGSQDSGWSCWNKVLTKIREYAKTHARRGFVFINAHTHGIKIGNKLLFDFHAYPYRLTPPAGATAHAPSENNPQKAEIQSLYHDSIYNRSLGGETYSGWSCESLPYFVELDNFGTDKNKLDQPTYGTHYIWGMDEISWFANQPQWYRHEWLSYAYKQVRTVDPAGYAQMPGNRTAVLRTPSGALTQLSYYCNSNLYHNEGFNDESVIRQIWVNDRKTR